MPATFVTAGSATITVDGTDYSCQITGFDPGWTDQTTPSPSGELTACGDPVPSDQNSGEYPASPTLRIVHDWSTTGLSRALAAAVGTQVPLVVELDTDQPAQQRSYSGTVIVPPVPDDWTPGKLERTDDLTFTAVSLTGPTFT